MSGSGPIYEYQRELTARLEQALRERDEARSAARELRAAIVDWLACHEAQGDPNDCRRFDLAPAIAHAEYVAGMTDAEISWQEWARAAPSVTEGDK